MLRFLALLPQVTLLALAVYNLATALPGLARTVPAPPGTRGRRFRVVIPAHNEGHLIGNVLADLADQQYEPALVSIWVLADRCTDDTESIARNRGAEVASRREGPDGKGAALRWYLAGHPLRDEEALVVLDADNRVPAGLFGTFADELDANHRALQAYVDVSNPDSSWLATAAALSYWASNRMVQQARTNLDWPADLAGTGMCLSAEALMAAGGFGSGLTEDQELTARLVLAGIPPRFLPDLKVGDEKPVDLWVAIRQRARWAAGKVQQRKTAIALLLKGLEIRSAGAFDLAIRTLQPSRTLMVGFSGLLALAAALWPGKYLLPWPVWLAAVAVQFLAPIPFLVREGVPAKYLWRYPLLAVFALLWLPVRVVARRATGWYHTPHRGTPQPK